VNETNLVDKLNRLLPQDIAVSQIKQVADDMHARFDAVARTYHYHVYTGKDPFLRHYATRLYYEPDYDLMNLAAEQLLQYTDFTSFSKLHSDAKTNICHVEYARWVQVAPNHWRFEIKADRFLRNMVRAIVGTLLEVGRGRLTLIDFSKVIESKSRNSAGESVPAKGLSLVAVDYPTNKV
jgi:tRNA pseudouridine38-40 synthase